MEYTNKISLNSNALKIIAIIAMIVDHTAIWLVAEGTKLDTVLHFVGRLAAPIMCYLIAEGYYHTSNHKRYLKRLFMFALISHFPFILFLGLEWWQGTSIIWGLFLGLLALTFIYSESIPLVFKIVLVIMCCLLAWTADWNYIGVLWIVAFGLLRKNFSLQMLGFVLLGLILYIIPGFYSTGSAAIFRLGILLVIPLFILYNGTRGKKSFMMKWGFYIFYPLHFLILYVLRYHIFD